MNKKCTEIKPDIIVAGQPCYTRRALAQALGKSVQTIAGWSTRKYGPSYFLVGRRVLYPANEVKVWLRKTMVRPQR